MHSKKQLAANVPSLGGCPHQFENHHTSLTTYMSVCSLLNLSAWIHEVGRV